MSNECFLIVKTGRNGASIADLEETQVNIGSRSVKLSGNCRLIGNWMRATIRVAKDRGISGRISVFGHQREDAIELIHEHQRMLVKLCNDIDWAPVALVDISEQELRDITSRLTEEFYELKYQTGDLIKTGARTFKYSELDTPAYEKTRGYERREWRARVVKRIRDEAAAYVSQGISPYVKFIDSTAV